MINVRNGFKFYKPVLNWRVIKKYLIISSKITSFNIIHVHGRIMNGNMVKEWKTMNNMRMNKWEAP